MTDVSIALPTKRRRGRPRKDTNLPGKPTPSHSIGPARPGNLRPDASLRYNNPEVDPRPMVGSSISGVVEGLFDAGYLISIRIGNSGTPFRGVVFRPCKSIPNPQAQMYQKGEITGPFPNGPSRLVPSKPMIFQPSLLSLPLSADPCFGNQRAFMSQAISFPQSGAKVEPPGPPRITPNQQWPPVHPADEAFDVSSIDQASRVDGKLADFTCHNDMPKPTFEGMYYDGPNATFHHNTFADRSRPDFRDPMHLGPEYNRNDFTEHGPNSPNLKLDLTSLVHRKNAEACWERNYSSCYETNAMNLSGNRLSSPLDSMNLRQMNSGAHQEMSHESPPQSTINIRPGSSVG